MFFPPHVPPHRPKTRFPPSLSEMGGKLLFPPQPLRNEGEISMFPPHFLVPPHLTPPHRGGELNVGWGGNIKMGGKRGGEIMPMGGNKLLKWGKYHIYEGEIMIFLVSPPFRVIFRNLHQILGFPPILMGVNDHLTPHRVGGK